MPPTPLTGRVIAGRYNLVEKIGRGAMGVVWRARDSLLDRDVAIKEVFLNGVISDEDRENAYKRTMREARTAARLSHRGVVTIYDVAEEDGRPWIIMEFVASRSLDQVLEADGPLPPRRACRIGQQLLAALAAAHAAGVMHRDVKPSNVLIANDPDGERAVLTDFGIAQFAGDPRLTQTGMVMGSPGFTAPERIRGGSATSASDLWSLGATLFAAVEGHGPYEERGGAITTMTAIINEDAPPATSAGPLGPLIAALLHRNPRLRPPAAAAARMFAGVLPLLPQAPPPARRTPALAPSVIPVKPGAGATSQDAVPGTDSDVPEESGDLPQAGTAHDAVPDTPADTENTDTTAGPVSEDEQPSEDDTSEPAALDGAADTSDAKDETGEAGEADKAGEAEGVDKAGQVNEAEGVDEAGQVNEAEGVDEADEAGETGQVDTAGQAEETEGAEGASGQEADSPAGAEPPALEHDAGETASTGTASTGTASTGTASTGTASTETAREDKTGTARTDASDDVSAEPEPDPDKQVPAGKPASATDVASENAADGWDDQPTRPQMQPLRLPPASARVHRRGRRTVVTVVVMLLAAVIGTAIALTARHRPPAENPGDAAAATSRLPDPVKAINDPASALPADWGTDTVAPSDHGTAGGFSIAVPSGWTVRQQKLATYLDPPDGLGYIDIDLTRHDRTDMLAEAVYVEHHAIAKGYLPGYHRDSLRRVIIRGHSGAFWAFTWVNARGVTMQVNDLLFSLPTAQGQQSYAAYFTAPAAQFQQSGGLPLFDQVLQTFHPVMN